MHALCMQGDPKASDSVGKGQVEAFWGSLVEPEFFTSSHERKFLAFQLFIMLLPHLRSGLSLQGACHITPRWPALFLLLVMRSQLTRQTHGSGCVFAVTVLCEQYGQAPSEKCAEVQPTGPLKCTPLSSGCNTMAAVQGRACAPRILVTFHALPNQLFGAF